MCITLSPATLKDTYIYAGDAIHPTSRQLVHVLAYQNKAKNRHTGPNAMLLPIPTKSLSRDNSLDCSGNPQILQQLWKAVASRYVEREERLYRSMQPKTITFEVFRTGSYTVVIAPNSSLVTQAISNLPSDLQPSISRAVVASFEANYPDWPIAICTWDGNIEPEPLVWWYAPLTPDKIFIPALDSHNGKAPVRNADVKRDHRIMVGSTLQPFGIPAPGNPEVPSALTSFISSSIWGVLNKGTDFNRDYYISTAALRNLRPPSVHLGRDILELDNLTFEYY